MTTGEMSGVGAVTVGFVYVASAGRPAYAGMIRADERFRSAAYDNYVVFGPNNGVNVGIGVKKRQH